VLENVAKFVIVILVLGSMFLFGHATNPGAEALREDRILSWSFVVFSVGLAELFVLFVILSVMGKIELAQAFYDKTGSKEPAPDQAEAASQPDAPVNLGGTPDGTAALKANPEGAAPAPGRPAKKPATRPAKEDTPPVSLSRLQAFMWTLVVITVYFHRVVKSGSGDLPPIPPELLMVMGISGAAYLVSKSINSSDASKPKPAKK